MVLDPPRDLPIWGVTNQVSKPKINTDCTKDFKKKPDTRGSFPSLLRILVILFHTALIQNMFLTTSDQLYSALEITRVSYWKEFIISRGRP